MAAKEIELLGLFLHFARCPYTDLTRCVFVGSGPASFCLHFCVPLETEVACEREDHASGEKSD